MRSYGREGTCMLCVRNAYSEFHDTIEVHLTHLYDERGGRSA